MGGGRSSAGRVATKRIPGLPNSQIGLGLPLLSCRDEGGIAVNEPLRPDGVSVYFFGRRNKTPHPKQRRSVTTYAG